MGWERTREKERRNVNDGEREHAGSKPHNVNLNESFILFRIYRKKVIFSKLYLKMIQT